MAFVERLFCTQTCSLGPVCLEFISHLGFIHGWLLGGHCIQCVLLSEIIDWFSPTPRVNTLTVTLLQLDTSWHTSQWGARLHTITLSPCHSHPTPHHTQPHTITTQSIQQTQSQVIPRLSEPGIEGFYAVVCVCVCISYPLLVKCWLSPR